MSSPIARRITGTYVVDSRRPLSSVTAWAQDECRNGSLRGLVEKFAEAQAEPLDVGLLLVEKVDGDGILARIPCKIVDHESLHPFQSEVWLKINPLVREVVRVTPP
ncbi:MAG: hypothetical protein ACOYB3_00950 [Azonexus sp.]